MRRVTPVPGAVAAALATLPLVVSCGGPRPVHTRPDVLLITIDTVRADHCSAYGYDLPTTPTLERLAGQGVLFEEAYSPMPTTGPAHATMFTSLPPRAHGFRKNGHLLREEFETLAEVLQRNGYRTGAVVSSFAVHSKFGLRQGFQDYNDDFGSAPGEFRARKWEGHVVNGAFDQDAVTTTDESIEWLRAHHDDPQPFFLWVHYFDPHWPYRPPGDYAHMFKPKYRGSVAASLAAYDGEIRETDDGIARLLKHVDDSTLLIVAGDHGEEFMQHGWQWHDLHLYEESVRVPLVVRWLGHLPAGRRLKGPVELADIMPTVLELAGIRDPALRMTGMSLVPPMRGEQALPPDREIFLERRLYKSGFEGNFRIDGDKAGVRIGPLKYIEAEAEKTFELYDLVNDPMERVNKFSERRGDAERLAERLRAWWAATENPHDEQAVSPEDVERLRSLGYVE